MVEGQRKKQANRLRAIATSPGLPVSEADAHLTIAPTPIGIAQLDPAQRLATHCLDHAHQVATARRRAPRVRLARAERGGYPFRDVCRDPCQLGAEVAAPQFFVHCPGAKTVAILSQQTAQPDPGGSGPRETLIQRQATPA